ncbi:MAG: hypothetical protein RR296_01200 [Clostridia bacterium]
MFKEFASLTRKYKMKIVIAMLILIVPMGVYAVRASILMYNNKVETVSKYDQTPLIDDAKMAELTIVEGSVPVKTGMYMESITNVSVSNNSWQNTFLLWFRWNDADDPMGYLKDPADYPGNRFIIGNGSFSPASKTLMIDRHGVEDGLPAGEHYQQYRISSTVEKYFDTTRYPLDSHQLKIFIEDERDMSRVRLIPDDEFSGVSPYLTVAGFDVINTTCGSYLNEYSSKMNDPVFENVAFETEGKKTMEFVFVTRVARSGYGLFLKAFLSLFGMLLWVCIGLYNNAYNRVDAMGAMNTGIFGAVSSMIVGMNLLSDARGSGLIEYVNFFALAMILITTVYVISINRARARKEDVTYTDCYAQMLFWVVVILTVATIASFILTAAV